MKRAAKEQQIKIFGTDGVRGRANYYPMTVEVALALGRAAGKIFRSHSGKHKVVVGKDTRLSCYMFENALIAGLCSMGINTLMLGPFPTPGVAFITRAYRADAGIVISASHNNFVDNGIKFFCSEGFKLPDELEKEIELLVASGEYTQEDLPSDSEIGRNSRVKDADGRYIEFVKATFPKFQTLNKIKISLDCANGAGYKISPLVFSELGADVNVLGNQPNGLNINLECGSTYLGTVQKGVIDHHSNVGISIDGDGDRLIMTDEHAQIVDGDTILGIIALHMKEKGLLTNNTVVGTVMTNLGMIHTLEKEGIRVIQAKVGDRYVIQEMLNHKAILGGEQSGHVICLNHNTTGDALVAALQVLSIMIEKEMPLSDLRRQIQKYPQTLKNIEVSSKPPLESLKGVTKALKKAEESLKGKGRVLVRYSGTENICRILVEGQNHKKIDGLADDIASEIVKEIG